MLTIIPGRKSSWKKNKRFRKREMSKMSEGSVVWIPRAFLGRTTLGKLERSGSKGNILPRKVVTLIWAWELVQGLGTSYCKVMEEGEGWYFHL